MFWPVLWSFVAVRLPKIIGARHFQTQMGSIQTQKSEMLRKSSHVNIAFFVVFFLKT